MKKYLFFPVISLAGGAAAFLLRLMQNRTGFEADTGLPVPGCLSAWLLPVLLAALGGIFLLSVRRLPGERSATLLRFQDYFCADGAGIPTLLVAGVFLWFLSGVCGIAPVFSADASRKDLIVGLLSSLTGGCLFSVIAPCRRGSRKLLNGNLLLAPVVYLVIRLVLSYRENSVNPSLTAYYVELLALVFGILAFYRASSFAFGSGRTRRFTVYACMSLVLGIATLADAHTLSDRLLFGGDIAFVLGLLLLRLSAVAWAEKPAQDSPD